MKIAIWGFGITGKASLKYFLESDRYEGEELDIHVYDSNEFDVSEYSDVQFHLGVDGVEDIESFDLLVLSPGISKYTDTVVKAYESGVEVYNDVSLFLKYFEGKTAGVTGTNGKSTVVSLIQGSLEAAGVKSILVGNIGKSPLDYLLEIERGELEADIAVMELSSFQLEIFNDEQFTDVSAILNITPDHLNRHMNDVQEYTNAKLNMMGDSLITVVDDPGVQKYVLPNVKNVIPITLDEIDSELETFIDEEGKKLKGQHNLYNIAVCLKVLGELGVDISDDVISFIKGYAGLEHRIEFVREIDGVKYINDSKSTTPESTLVALEAYGDQKNIIFFAGGTDKGSSFDVWKDYLIKYVKYVIVMDNEINEKMVDLCRECEVEYSVVDGMFNMVEMANDLSEEGDVVLLSPGAASFGKFVNYEDRGRQFKEEVGKL